MIYLSGVMRSNLPNGVGIMVNPRSNLTADRLSAFPCFAIDNDCFNLGHAFDGASWLAHICRFTSVQDRCLFAVAPDVVGDAAATLERSAPYFDRIRALGFRVAFVAQDGQDTLPVPWDAFDCLFIGGTDAWKLSESAYDLMRQARQRGKWVHAGRVNSLRRLRLMQLAGAQSADGTFVKYAPDLNVLRVQEWLEALARQPPLFTTARGRE